DDLFAELPNTYLEGDSSCDIARSHHSPDRHPQPACPSQQPLQEIRISCAAEAEGVQRRRQFLLQVLAENDSSAASPNLFGLIVQLVELGAKDAAASLQRRCFHGNQENRRPVSVCILASSVSALEAADVDDQRGSPTVLELLPENLARFLAGKCARNGAHGDAESAAFAVLCSVDGGELFCLSPGKSACLKVASPTDFAASGTAADFEPAAAAESAFRLGGSFLLRVLGWRLGRSDRVALIFADARLLLMTFAHSGVNLRLVNRGSLLGAGVGAGVQVADCALVRQGRCAVLTCLLTDGRLRLVSAAALDDGSGGVSAGVDPGLADCRSIVAATDSPAELLVQFADFSQCCYPLGRLLDWLCRADAQQDVRIQDVDDGDGEACLLRLTERLNGGLDRLAALAAADRTVTRRLAQLAHLLRLRASIKPAKSCGISVAMEIRHSGRLCYLSVAVNSAAANAQAGCRWLPGPASGWRCVLELRWPAAGRLRQRIEFPLTDGEVHLPLPAASNSPTCSGGEQFLQPVLIARLSLGLAAWPGAAPSTLGAAVLATRSFWLTDFAVSTTPVDRRPWTPLSLLACPQFPLSAGGDSLLGCGGHLSSSVGFELPQQRSSLLSNSFAWGQCSVRIARRQKQQSVASAVASTDCLAAAVATLVSIWAASATADDSTKSAATAISAEQLARDREALTALATLLRQLSATDGAQLPRMALAQALLDVARRLLALDSMAQAAALLAADRGFEL
ncbi:hypothetical protein BOX15_Mlig021211g2, partial [Macrostomum lignano]